MLFTIQCFTMINYYHPFLQIYFIDKRCSQNDILMTENTSFTRRFLVKKKKEFNSKHHSLNSLVIRTKTNHAIG